MRAAADEPGAEDKGSQRQRRDKILNSDSWRRTLEGLDEWFSIQTIYSRPEADQFKKKLVAQVQQMSGGELEAYQSDLDAKLQLVLGPEGREILNWVGASLAAAAPSYRKKMDLQYPDILKLTAAQLREQIDFLERKRDAARNQSAALEHARQVRISGLQAEQRQQSQERDRALDRGAAGGYPSPYHPGAVRQYPDVVSRPPYGWGFGFW